MKKEKYNDDFDLVDLKDCTEEEIYFLAKVATLVLEEDEDGNYYCWDYSIDRCLFFDKKKKEWSKYYDSDFHDKCKGVDTDKSHEFYKKYPPFEIFENWDKEEAEKELKYWEKLCKKTPHKVVGWVSVVYGIYDPCNDRDESYSAAIINDIKEHKYEFAPNVFELVPVFEDGTYINYSTRGWGRILALANGEADQYAYVDYAFYGVGEIKEPEEGFYDKKELHVILPHKEFELLLKNNCYFFDNKENEIYSESHCIVDEFKVETEFDIKTPYYFIFVDEENGDDLSDVHARFMTFKDVDEYHKFVDNLEIDEHFKIFVCSNHMRIEEKLEKGPLTVIKLIQFPEYD